jgi:hypothetical protein
LQYLFYSSEKTDFGGSEGEKALRARPQNLRKGKHHRDARHGRKLFSPRGDGIRQGVISFAKTSDRSTDAEYHQDLRQRCRER